MSYARTEGQIVWTYPVGHSTWAMVAAAFEELMTYCVIRGAGGAIVISRESLNYSCHDFNFESNCQL